MTDDERVKTAEIIRPILRGRDIKRYSYEFADQYVIATFPSRQYNIDDYQSIKSYLLSFGIEKLEQTGKEYVTNGETVKARKKTNNKWFETQDSINYWDVLELFEDIAIIDNNKASQLKSMLNQYGLRHFPVSFKINLQARRVIIVITKIFEDRKIDTWTTILKKETVLQIKGQANIN